MASDKPSLAWADCSRNIPTKARTLTADPTLSPQLTTTATALLRRNSSHGRSSSIDRNTSTSTNISQSDSEAGAQVRRHPNSKKQADQESDKRFDEKLKRYRDLNDQEAELDRARRAPGKSGLSRKDATRKSTQQEAQVVDVQQQSSKAKDENFVSLDNPNNSAAVDSPMAPAEHEALYSNEATDGESDSKTMDVDDAVVTAREASPSPSPPSSNFEAATAAASARPPEPASITSRSTNPVEVPLPLADLSEVADDADTEEIVKRGKRQQQTTSTTSGSGSIFATINAWKQQPKTPEEKKREEEEKEERRVQAAEVRRQVKQVKELDKLVDQLGGPAAVMDEIDLLRHQGRELLTALRSRDRDIHHLRAQITAGEGRENALSRDLQVKEKLYVDTKKELDESRAFVEASDRGDIGDVKKEVEGISTELSDLVYTVVEKITSVPGSPIDSQACVPLSDDVLAPLLNYLEGHPGLSRLAQNFAQTPGRGVFDFLSYGSELLVAKEIDRSVFSTFKPGMPEAERKVIAEAYERVRHSEPQGKAGRWRSITYERVCPSSEDTDAALCLQISQQLVSQLTAFVNLVFALPLPLPTTSSTPSDAKNAEADTSDVADADLDTDVIDEQPKEDERPKSPAVVPPQVSLQRWEGDFTELVSRALAWHSKMRKSYLSYDYTATLVQPKRTKELDVIVAPQGFGLKQTRSVPAVGRTGGGMKIELDWLLDVPGLTTKDL